MPVRAVRKRLPKLCPRRPPPFGKRYWKRRARRSSSSASATMQLRMSPGGSTPNSRRSRPEEPPSSVTVTTPVSWASRGVPTWCLSPRSSAERPVPPPMAAREEPAAAGGEVPAGSGEPDELTEARVPAELGEVGVVECMDAILGAQLDGAGQRLGRLVRPPFDGVDRGGEVGETFVLLVVAALAADRQRGGEVAAVLRDDGLQIGVGALLVGLLLLVPLRLLLAADGEVLAGALPHLRRVALLDDAREELGRFRPALAVQRLER